MKFSAGSLSLQGLFYILRENLRAKIRRRVILIKLRRLNRLKELIINSNTKLFSVRISPSII